MLEQNVFSPSISSCHSPAVLVKKKDGQFRFAVDYSLLNKVTHPIEYPIPKVEEVIDGVGDAHAQIFSV